MGYSASEAWTVEMKTNTENLAQGTLPFTFTKFHKTVQNHSRQNLSFFTAREKIPLASLLYGRLTQNTEKDDTRETFDAIQSRCAFSVQHFVYVGT